MFWSNLNLNIRRIKGYKIIVHSTRLLNNIQTVIMLYWYTIGDFTTVNKKFKIEGREYNL